VRQAAAEISSIVHYKLLGFLTRTAGALGLTYREMLNLVPSEIIGGLDGTLSLEQLKHIVQRRANYNWCAFSKYGTGELVVVDEAQDLDELFKRIVPVADENTEVITGQTGNKGKRQGRVSVILATDDFSKFVEGNVLVTTMTTPDFVILMQKSIAIVTDIGGMLSHASIVSRELGVPCVIGTKFATQVLHDGDLVEVDADNGVVRIIERAK
jgi:phosphohistidine swiveling domain-containing protein